MDGVPGVPLRITHLSAKRALQSNSTQVARAFSIKRATGVVLADACVFKSFRDRRRTCETHMWIISYQRTPIPGNVSFEESSEKVALCSSVWFAHVSAEWV